MGSLDNQKLGRVAFFVAAIAVAVIILAPWLFIKVFRSLKPTPPETYETPKNIETPSKPIPLPNRDCPKGQEKKCKG